MLPGSDAAVVGSYAGRGALPFGIVSGADGTFVLLGAARSEAGVGPTRRIRAQRLGRDGSALCLDSPP